MMASRNPFASVAHLLAMCLLAAGVSAAEPRDLAALQQQVEDTERSFARTMAERDHEAFQSFLSEETVFFSGDAPLRGKQAVAEAWKPFFEGAEAPFSWAPERVVVLDSGTLALSSGPVWNSAGQRVATFNSVWRLEPSGQWKIVFDKGSVDCPQPVVGSAE